MEQCIGKREIDEVLSGEKALVSEMPYVSKERLGVLISHVNALLGKLNRRDFSEPFKYIVNEMINNAGKANLKRLYFKEKGLNITDPVDYLEGMKGFSSEQHEFIEAFKDKLEKNGFYTRFSVQVKNGLLLITTVNNSLPTHEELDRIRARVELSARLRDVAEAYMSIYDSSEGAGFGIISTVLMLRGLGAHEGSYRFDTDMASGESIAEVRMPLNAVPERDVEHISDEIAREIATIPKLPENIIEIERMLADPEISFSEISRVVSSDPGLTAELLKMVNSAQFMLLNNVTSIQSAVTLIGARGLKNLLYLYGAIKSIETQHTNLTDLWDHSYRCAFYSHTLANQFKLHDIADDVYISGILHDLGEIILKTLQPDLLDKIASHCRGIGVADNFLEALIIGVGHAKIGAMICRHWKFPEQLISPIEFHHQPFLAPEDHYKGAHLVYLANLLAEDYENRINFSAIDENALKIFGIGSESEFRELSETLALKFQGS